MLPDDVFRNRVRDVCQTLEQWCEGRKDVARITRETGAGFWRLAAVPGAAQACPVEVVIHHAAQTIDLGIGRESCTGLGVEVLERLPALFAAVEAGLAIERCWHSALTELPLAVDTLVPAGDGETWLHRRVLGRGRTFDEHDAIASDHRYTPWRRLGHGA